MQENLGMKVVCVCFQWHSMSTLTHLTTIVLQKLTRLSFWALNEGEYIKLSTTASSSQLQVRRSKPTFNRFIHVCLSVHVCTLQQSWPKIIIHACNTKQLQKFIWLIGFNLFNSCVYVFLNVEEVCYQVRPFLKFSSPFICTCHILDFFKGPSGLQNLWKYMSHTHAVNQTHFVHQESFAVKIIS